MIPSMRTVDAPPSMGAPVAPAQPNHSPAPVSLGRFSLLPGSTAHVAPGARYLDPDGQVARKPVYTTRADRLLGRASGGMPTTPLTASEHRALRTRQLMALGGAIARRDKSLAALKGLEAQVAAGRINSLQNHRLVSAAEALRKHDACVQTWVGRLAQDYATGELDEALSAMADQPRYDSDQRLAAVLHLDHHLVAQGQASRLAQG